MLIYSALISNSWAKQNCGSIDDFEEKKMFVIRFYSSAIKITFTFSLFPSHPPLLFAHQ